MTLLLVGNCAERLGALATTLSRILPKDDIRTEVDPLMAVKFALDHCVDMVFAEWNMKRMNGQQFGEIVTQINPSARVFLIGCQDVFDDCMDDLTGLFGLLYMPVTEMALREALNPLIRNQSLYAEQMSAD